MKVSELRAAIRDLPGDAEVFIEDDGLDTPAQWIDTTMWAAIASDGRVCTKPSEGDAEAESRNWGDAVVTRAVVIR